MKKRKPVEPLPPVVQDIAKAEVRALEATADQPRPSSLTLRRDESVIAAAAKLRGSPVRRFFVETAGMTAARVAVLRTAWKRGQLYDELATRFSTLSPTMRISLVAAPFMLAILVSLIALLWSSDPEPTSPRSSYAAQARAIVPAADPKPAQAAPVAPPAPPPAEAPSALDRIKSEAPSGPSSSGVALQVAEIARTVPAKTTLYAAPKKGAPKTATINAGGEILMYPGLPAPMGWVVARKPKGEIGFLKEASLLSKAEAPAGGSKIARRAVDDDRPKLVRRAPVEEPRRRAMAAPRPRNSGKPLTADDLLLR